MSFVIRKFDNELKLGQKLKALRKEANITIYEMEEKTKINRSVLMAIEAGEYHKLPDPIYSRNFLKIYIRTLNADENYFLDLFEQECGTCDFMKKARLPRARAPKRRFMVASRFIKIGAISLTAIAVVAYIGLQVQSIVSAPNLLVTAPNDGLMTKDATIIVTGESDPGSTVTINGAPVLLSQDGFFEEEIALERGLNVITIEGAKRYSKKATQYRRVIVDQNKILGIASP